ncbi:hypothetical protein FRC07_007157 [Ceratobasidium sp. 392]|nr:hypothetical protein FRC07_007157 [Ceratobasidium sp. 392]
MVVQEGGNVIFRNISVTLGDTETKTGKAKVDLRTINAPITARFVLSGSGPFTALCSTEHALINLNVTAQLRGALLTLEAKTNNAPASVQLHPNYEGTLELTSSEVVPNVVVTEIPGRTVSFETVGTRVVGSVWYEKKEGEVREGGKVVVCTSSAPNTLSL